MEIPQNDSAMKEDTEIVTASEEAIIDLNNAIRSSNKDFKLIIADLKKLVQGDEKREVLLERNCYPLKLRDDGLTDSEIRNLSRVLSIQENYVTFQNNFHFILVAFCVIESGKYGFQQFCDSRYADNFPQIGVMVCEILFHSKVYQLAKKYLNLKSFVEIQTQVLKVLKNKLLDPPYYGPLDVIHMIASCGNRMKDAVPDEIGELDFSWRKFNVTDMIAVTSVMSHCTQVRSLSFFYCGVSSSCLETFLSRLWKSELKISEINFGRNKNMGVDGLEHVGAIVKQHQVDTLSLTSCGLNADELESFTKGAGDAKLMELDISNNDLTVANAGSFGAFVSKNGVKILNMSDCGLQFKHVDSFTRNLGDAKIKRLDISNQMSQMVRSIFTSGSIFTLLPHVTENLDLTENGLNEHEISNIQDFLDYDTTRNLNIQVGKGRTLISELRDQEDLLRTLRQKLLEALDAQSDKSQISTFCCIARLIHSCESLAKEIVPKQIQSIDLSGKILREYDARALAAVTSHCSLVRKLDLSHCDLTFKGAVALRDGLKKSKSKISEVDASQNPKIRWKGVVAIGVIASEHATEKLKLGSCKLRANDVSKLCKTLDNFQENDNLQLSELDISGNEDIGVKGCEAVGKMAAKTGIKKLNMSSCGMGLDHFQSFAEKLEDAKMTHLDISHQESYPLTAILALLPHVSKNLMCGTVSDFSIEHLQYYLNYHHPTTLKITIGHVMELKSEPSDLNNFHQSLRQRFLTSKSQDLINIIHFIHSCEGLAKDIVPEKLSSINLSGTKLSKFDAKVLIKVTSHCIIIRRLSLSNCNITAYVFSGLLNFKPKIFELDFSNDYEMDAKRVECVGKIVGSNIVEKLDLSYCGLQNNQIEVLHEVTKNVKFLELDISGNEDIGVEGCESVGKMVSKTGIQKLNMSSCGMESDHFQGFTEKLEDTKMTHLDVSHQQSYPLKAILALLPHVTEKLQLIRGMVSLFGTAYFQDYLNYHHPTNLKIAIADVMELNSEPSNLNSFYQSLRQRFLKSQSLELSNIMHFIHSCEGLAKEIVPEEIPAVHLGGTKLSKFDAGVLIKVTSHCTVIWKLSLSNCNITAGVVSELLSLKPKLSELDISNNEDIEVEGCEAVGQMVSKAEIRKLNMRSCGMELDHFQAFTEKLENTKMMHLNISHQQSCPLKAIFTLLPNVTESLQLNPSMLSVSGIYYLQDWLNYHHPTMLKITVAGVMELKSNLADLETLNLSLKERFLSLRSLELSNIIHFIHSCEDLAKAVLSEEIHSIHLDGTKLSKFDAKVLVKVTSHCTIVRKLSLSNCRVTACVVNELLGLVPKIAHLILSQQIASTCLLSNQKSFPLAAVCNLLHMVTESLDLSDNHLTPDDQSILQSHLNSVGSTDLKIIIAKDIVLTKDTKDSRSIVARDLPPLGEPLKKCQKLDGDKISADVWETSPPSLELRLGKEKEIFLQDHTSDKEDSNAKALADSSIYYAPPLEKKTKLMEQGNVDIEVDVSKSRPLSLHLKKEKHEYEGNDDIEVDIWKSRPSSVHLKQEKQEYQDNDDIEADVSNNRPSFLHLKQEKQEYQEQSLTEQKTENFGIEGATIAVGGCSVTFPKGAIRSTKTVIVTAKIDSTLLPPEKKAITPILDVNVRHLDKPAIVRLMTWCVDDQHHDTVIEVIGFVRSWENRRVIHRCKLGHSGVLKFECSYFSSVVGIKNNEADQLTYSLQPVICTVQRKCYIALLKCTTLEMKHIMTIAKGEYSTLCYEFSNVKCRTDDELVIKLEVGRENPLQFDPTDVKYLIKNIIQSDKPSHKFCLLKGDVRETPVEILCTILRNGDKIQCRSIYLYIDVDKKVPITQASEYSAYHSAPPLKKPKLLTQENEEEKAVEDDTSKNTSTFYDSSFAKQAKIIQEDSFEQRFMTETDSKEVGPEGATITVGGCSITFPEGCFNEKETVWVAAKIDSTVLPPGREAVTPILHVIVENMKKPALVSLMTWCAEDPNNDVYVAIVRLDESWEGWKVIHRCKLLNSGFIEFECDGFSDVVGVAENENVPLTYLLQPVICTVKRTCNIALLKCEKLEMKHFLSTSDLDTFLDMTEEDHHSKFRNLQLTLNKISCKREDEVKSEIILKSNEESLNFDPKESLFDINDVTENDKPTYNSCLIEGKITESPVKIIFFLIKNGERKQNRVVDLHMEVDAETALAVAPNQRFSCIKSEAVSGCIKSEVNDGASTSSAAAQTSERFSNLAKQTSMTISAKKEIVVKSETPDETPFPEEVIKQEAASPRSVTYINQFHINTSSTVSVESGDRRQIQITGVNVATDGSTMQRQDQHCTETMSVTHDSGVKPEMK